MLLDLSDAILVPYLFIGHCGHLMVVYGSKSPYCSSFPQPPGLGFGRDLERSKTKKQGGGAGGEARQEEVTERNMTPGC
jgi:hypothetical protein